MFKRKKRPGMGIGLADHSRKSPLSADEQDSPQPERMGEPAEKTGESRRDPNHPSQAEGDRDETAERPD